MSVKGAKFRGEVAPDWGSLVDGCSRKTRFREAFVSSAVDYLEGVMMCIATVLPISTNLRKWSGFENKVRQRKERWWLNQQAFARG